MNTIRKRQKQRVEAGPPIALVLLGLFLTVSSFVHSQLPLPSQAQLLRQDMEICLFIHFGPNTFTGKEWGYGNEPETVFNPVALDCRQWARIAKQAGAKGIIITAKHHDGFCLWPSRFSTHTVRESKWKNGKGDVLKELSAACREYGLKFGVYISPWDRNHPEYGTAHYNDVFINMMKEVLTQYGPVWELWWDGANGEGPNGKKQVYDWKRFERTVRKLSPSTVIFSDIGPDLRWVGNENGTAGTTNWNYLDTAGFTRGAGAPPTDTLNSGNRYGHQWIPAECDVSIRPGWFYHASEDEKVKTPEELFLIYLRSVGRGASLLLNVPPDQRGLINEKDSASLAGFKKLRDQCFGHDLALEGLRDAMKSHSAYNDHNDKTYGCTHYNAVDIKFRKEETINCVVLKERITEGQRCSSFQLVLKNGNEVIKEWLYTTIGHKRILTFPGTKVTSLSIWVEADELHPVCITGIEAYKIDSSLIEKKD